MELDELYQELIIDHGTKPRNFGELSEYSHNAEGFNPLCGDKIHVYVKLEKDKITNVSFSGCGCAISQASASIMTETIKNQSLDTANKYFDDFTLMVTSQDEVDIDALGKLKALSGVRKFPSRVKCATLAWHTLLAALKKKESVTTED